MLLFDVRIHIPRSYAGEEFYIFVRVELGHLSFRGRFGSLISAFSKEPQTSWLWMLTNISILLYKP